jgi:hypothetical protein
MDCSSEEAFSRFFNVWRNAETSLLATAIGGLKPGERCIVKDTSPGQGSIHIKSESGEWESLLDLKGVTFSCEDFRNEAPPEGVIRKWRCFLSADFPDGRKLLFAEPVPGIENTP